MFPVESPLQMIPCNRSCNFEARLPVAIDLDVYSSSGMLAISLYMIDVEPQLFQSTQSVDTTGVLAHAAGHNSLTAHQRGDVGEVRRSPSQTGAPGKQIPEHFPQTHDFVTFAHHRRRDPSSTARSNSRAASCELPCCL